MNTKCPAEGTKSNKAALHIFHDSYKLSFSGKLKKTIVIQWTLRSGCSQCVLTISTYRNVGHDLDHI